MSQRLSTLVSFLARRRIRRFIACFFIALPLAPLSGVANAQSEGTGPGYRWNRIEAPSPNALLLNLGNHFKVDLESEGKPVEVRVPLDIRSTGAIDLHSLHWARLSADKSRYEVLPEKAVLGKDAVLRVSQSGAYSLVGLPAEPIGKAVITQLCSTAGRPTRVQIDPICTKVYCPGFEQIGSMDLPGALGPSAGTSVCDRCFSRAGRLPEEMAECQLTVIEPGLQPIPFPKLPPLRPVLPVCTVQPASIADPSEGGTFAVGSSEYRFPDAINISSDPNVDVWATVRYPAASAGVDAPIAPGSNKFPLVVYLHGNHGTVISAEGYHVCGSTGTPVPNHEGYNYVLDRLASLGFIAVSINANDLNCKVDRIVERGKLILEHLRRWKNWNDPTQPDTTFSGRFYNRVDLTNIGLAGHSRGGEAIVSAYLENKTAGLGYGIKAIHSIAPVDVHSFVLEDVPFFLLLPAADGDVFDLQGARIYDRAAPRTNPTRMAKMQAHLYGANHNWFNTVWSQDEGSPPAGSPIRLSGDQQRTVERVMAVAFFRQYLQSFGTARGLFAGTTVVASLAPAEIYRSYQHPSHLNVDDFEDSPVNALLNSLGGANVNTSLSPFGEFPFSQSGGAFNGTFFHQTKGLIGAWNAPGDKFVVNIPAAKQNVSSYGYLSFRVTQVFDNGVINPTGQDQNFDVGLEDLQGNIIYLQVSQYDRIPFPYQRPSLVKSMMQTVRLGLDCFGCSRLVGINASAITRIHFRFNRTAAGLIGIDSIQFTR